MEQVEHDPDFIALSRQFKATAMELISILEQVSSYAEVSSYGEIEQDQLPQMVKGLNRRLLTYVDCQGLCKVRCGAHSRPNVCTRACGTCCARCKCVPPASWYLW